MVIRELHAPAIEHCQKCNNDCKVCPMLKQCDFKWVYDIGNKEDFLMGYWPVYDMKATFLGKTKTSYIIGTDDQQAFCHYNVVSKDGHYIKIDHMCVKEETKGKGYGTAMVKYLLDLYKLPLRAVCIADTSADTFWKHTAEKFNGGLISSKKTSIDRTVNVYQFGEAIIDDKEQLW